jgi:archaellum biogenesis ATPase FlaH
MNPTFEDKFVKVVLTDLNFARMVATDLKSARIDNNSNALIFDVFGRIFESLKTLPTMEIMLNEIGLTLKARPEGLHETEIVDIAQRLHFVYNENGLAESEYLYLKTEYKNLFFLRSARKALVEVIQKVDAEGVLDEQALHKLAKGAAPREEPIDWFSSVEDRTSLQLYDDSKVPTLIPPLDAALQGGLGAGELGIIMAGPKQGKSMLLINFGFAAVAVGKRVLHVTLELSAKQTLKRYDSIFTGIPINNLKNSREQLLLKFQDFSKFKDLLIIQQYPTKGVSAIGLEPLIQYVQDQKGKIDCVIVDYGDLLKANSKKDQVRFELEEIFYTLRQLASVHKVGVWTATQTNRLAVGKTDVDERHLAEAFSKAMICDILMSLTPWGDLKKLSVVLTRDSGAQSLFIPLRPQFESARLRYEQTS